MTDALVTHKDIEAVRQEFELISERVTEIHVALMGSTLSRDGGMIKRLADLEEDAEDIRLTVEAIARKNMKNNFYIHIIFAIGGALLMSIYNQIIAHLFK